MGNLLSCVGKNHRSSVVPITEKTSHREEDAAAYTERGSLDRLPVVVELETRSSVDKVIHETLTGEVAQETSTDEVAQEISEETVSEVKIISIIDDLLNQDTPEDTEVVPKDTAFSVPAPSVVPKDATFSVPAPLVVPKDTAFSVPAPSVLVSDANNEVGDDDPNLRFEPVRKMVIPQRPPLTEAELLVREEVLTMETELREARAITAREMKRDQLKQTKSNVGINLVDPVAGILNLVESDKCRSFVPAPILSQNLPSISSTVQPRDQYPKCQLMQIFTQSPIQSPLPTHSTWRPPVRTSSYGMSRPVSRLTVSSNDISGKRTDTPKPVSKLFLERSSSVEDLVDGDNCFMRLYKNKRTSLPAFQDQLLKVVKKAELIELEKKQRKDCIKEKKQKINLDKEVLLGSNLSMTKIEQFLETREHIDKTEFDLVVQNLVDSESKDLFPRSRNNKQLGRSVAKIPERIPFIASSILPRKNNLFVATPYTNKTMAGSRFPVIGDQLDNKKVGTNRKLCRQSPIGGNADNRKKLPFVSQNDIGLHKNNRYKNDRHFANLPNTLGSQKVLAFSRNAIGSLVQGSEISMRSERSKASKVSPSGVPIVEHVAAKMTHDDSLTEEVSAAALISCFHGNGNHDFVEVEPCIVNLNSLPPILNKPLVSAHPFPVSERVEINDNELIELFGCKDDQILDMHQLTDRSIDNRSASLISRHKAVRKSGKFCTRPSSRGGRVLMNWLNAKKLKRLKKQRPPDDFIEE